MAEPKTNSSNRYQSFMATPFIKKALKGKGIRAELASQSYVHWYGARVKSLDH